MGPRKSDDMKRRAVEIHAESLAEGKPLSAAKVLAKLAEEFPGQSVAVNSINNWIKKAKSEPATEATEGDKAEAQTDTDATQMPDGIRAGTFSDPPGPLAVSADGALMDGQTRLMAVAQAAEGPAVSPEMPEIHPLAESWHPLSDKDYRALVESIRDSQGNKESIKLYEGKIIDGRHRWRACVELGFVPKTEVWTRDPFDAVSHTVGVGRHSSASQKALAGARMMVWLKAQGEARIREAASEGGKAKARKAKGCPSTNKVLRQKYDSRSVVRAAKKSGGSKPAIQALFNIISDEKNPHRGNIELMVSDGRLTVAEAKALAALPDPQRGVATIEIMDRGTLPRVALGLVTPPPEKTADGSDADASSTGLDLSPKALRQIQRDADKTLSGKVDRTEMEEAAKRHALHLIQLIRAVGNVKTEEE